MICAWQKKRKYKNAENALDFPQMRIYSKGTINARRVLRGQAFITNKLSRERRDVNTEKIKELREKAGITQAELARRLGVTRAAVLFMESEGNYPQAWRLPEIANVIGCSVDALFGREARP